MESIIREEGNPVDLWRTLLAMIVGSVDSKQYQRVFVQQPGESVDVTRQGNFSCAVYVSALLHLCELIMGGLHTTVDETVSDMRASGWQEINYGQVHPGCVLVWGEANVCSDGKLQQHIGFFYELDNGMGGKAISNHPLLGVPKIHHVTFGSERGVPRRPIRWIFSHPLLRP